MLKRQIVFLTALLLSACGPSSQVTPVGGNALLNAHAVKHDGDSMISNGSFESPVVKRGSYRRFSTGQSFGGWKVTGAPGTVALTSGVFTRDGFHFLAGCGKQWLDIAFSGTPTSVTQVVPGTIPMVGYIIYFSVGNVYDPGGPFGTKSTIELLVDGRKVLSALNSSGRGSRNQVWQQFSVVFIASHDNTNVTFVNRDPHNDRSNGLDCIEMYFA